MIDKIKAKLTQLKERVLTANTMMNDARGVGDVIEIVKTLGLLVVIGAVMIFVADKTLTATGTVSNANLSAMQTNLLGSAQTGSSFIVVLIIAFIGAIAIGYMGFLGGKGRK